MNSVPAAVSYREDIVETLKERFFTRLDSSLEEGREPEISEAALAEIRAQYQTTFSNFLSTAFDVVFRNELASKLPGTVTGKLLRKPINCHYRLEQLIRNLLSSVDKNGSINPIYRTVFRYDSIHKLIKKALKKVLFYRLISFLSV